jgi:hypothetical protein
MSNGNGSGRGPRIPPSDLEAESSVLGAMLISGDAASTAVRLVRPDQFFKPAHQAVFAAAAECYRAGEGVDAVTVAHRLDVNGLLDFAGGKGALMELQAFPGAISNVGRYIAIVREAAERRGVIGQASTIADAAYDWGRPLARVYELMSPPADVHLTNRYDSHRRTAAELMSMPPPSWTIESVLPSGALVVTYGPPKSAKTFLALHQALCVATGIPMFGNRVQRQRVLYVVAEGVRALGQRIAAWCEWHHIERDVLDGWIAFVDVPVQLLDPGAVNDLKAQADDFYAGLLTLDTLARCMVGADENSSKDMSQAVAGMDELRSPTRVVHAVHHMGKNTESGMRGHSSLLGAVDTAIEVVGDRTTFKVTMTAQKDAEPYGAWWGKLVHCLDSVVIQETGKPTDDEVTRQSLMRAVSELLGAAKGEPYGFKDVVASMGKREGEVRAALKQLVVDGYVTKQPRKGRGGGDEYMHHHPYVPPPPADDDDAPF